MTGLSNRGWFLKAAAGLVLGLLLSFGLVGVVGVLVHAGGSPRDESVQFLMWMIAPVWCACLGGCFMFRSGLRAWGVFGGANVVLWGVYGGVRACFL